MGHQPQGTWCRRPAEAAKTAGCSTRNAAHIKLNSETAALWSLLKLRNCSLLPCWDSSDDGLHWLHSAGCPATGTLPAPCSWVLRISQVAAASISHSELLPRDQPSAYIHQLSSLVKSGNSLRLHKVQHTPLSTFSLDLHVQKSTYEQTHYRRIKVV